MAWALTQLHTIDSTMDWARARAREGAPDFTAVRAGTQTAGRGRRGRQWVSPPGNLYFSFVLRDENAGLLPLSLGLALHASFKSFLPDIDVALKWPNDVLVDGRKAAGILIEAEDGALIVGIGANVASAPDGAVALSEWRLDIDAAAFCARLQSEISALMERADPNAVIRDWNERAAWIGRSIRFRHGTETVAGTFEGVDGQGRALLRVGEETKAFASGEVMEVRPC